MSKVRARARARWWHLVDSNVFHLHPPSPWKCTLFEFCTLFIDCAWLHVNCNWIPRPPSHTPRYVGSARKVVYRPKNVPTNERTMQCCGVCNLLPISLSFCLGMPKVRARWWHLVDFNIFHLHPPSLWKCALFEFCTCFIDCAWLHGNCNWISRHHVGSARKDAYRPKNVPTNKRIMQCCGVCNFLPIFLSFCVRICSLCVANVSLSSLIVSCLSVACLCLPSPKAVLGGVLYLGEGCGQLSRVGQVLPSDVRTHARCLGF